MIENLLDGDLDDAQRGLLEEMDCFDLEDFYLGMGESNGAIALITKNQMIMCNNYVKDFEDKYSVHRKTFYAIYKAIYNLDIRERVIKPLAFWQGKAIDNGDILIQLCSGCYPSLVWVPEEMSNQQFEIFNNFNDRIKGIVRRNEYFFDSNPIEFWAYVGDWTKGIYHNNLDDLMGQIKKNKRR